MPTPACGYAAASATSPLRYMEFACEHMLNSDAHYRFVIDMKSLKKAELAAADAARARCSSIITISICFYSILCLLLVLSPIACGWLLRGALCMPKSTLVPRPLTIATCRRGVTVFFWRLAGSFCSRSLLFPGPRSAPLPAAEGPWPPHAANTPRPWGCASSPRPTWARPQPGRTASPAPAPCPAGAPVGAGQAPHPPAPRSPHHTQGITPCPTAHIGGTRSTAPPHKHTQPTSPPPPTTHLDATINSHKRSTTSSKKITMPSLKVTLCQMAVGADKTKNLQKAVSMITDAASRGSQFVVLPECFNCPYGTTFFEAYSEALCPGNQTYDAMSSVAKSNRVWLVAGSIPEKKDGKLYNSSMTFSPEGHLAHVHRKVHLFQLFTDAVKFDEAEVLTAGDDASAIKMNDDLLFGVAICFDIRYPQLAWKLASEGTSFIVYPGAFNMVTGPAHWELSARARAVDNQQYVLLCSPARDTDAGYVAWGHSLVVDPLGKVIASADEKESYVDAELDLDLVTKTRDQIPIIKGQRKDLYSLAWGTGN